MQFGIDVHNLTILRTNLTYRHAVGIVFAGVFYPDHAGVSTRFEDFAVRLIVAFRFVVVIFGLPESDVFVVKDRIDGVTNKPEVAFVAVSTRCECNEFVLVAVHVDASFPGYTVEIVEDGAVEVELPALVFGFTDVCHITGNTRCGGQAYAQEHVVGLLYVVFEATGDAVFEEAEVNTVVHSL